MIQTVEALIDGEGRVRLLRPVQVQGVRRALATILDDAADAAPSEGALLAKPALAADWNRPEEDAAWSHLQPEKSWLSRFRSQTSGSPRCGRPTAQGRAWLLVSIDWRPGSGGSNPYWLGSLTSRAGGDFLEAGITVPSQSPH